MTGKPAGRIVTLQLLVLELGLTKTLQYHVLEWARRSSEPVLLMKLRRNLETMTNVIFCESVLEMVEPIGGRGGIIAVDSDGNIAMPFQTMLMYRGAWKDGKINLGIYPELSL